MTAAVMTEPDVDPVETGRWRPTLGHALLLLVGGLLGSLAAFVLTVEKVRVLEDPNYVPSCNISPVIGCGTVMTSAQAEAFGFPNSLIGVVAFPVVAVLGLLALARVPLPRWVWWGLSVGATFGVGFVAWLISQSLYRISALCPYCMVVWTVTVPVFVVTLTWTLRQAFPASGGARFLHEWKGLVLVLAAATVLTLVLVRFWSYWSSLL